MIELLDRISILDTILIESSMGVGISEYDHRMIHAGRRRRRDGPGDLLPVSFLYSHFCFLLCSSSPIRASVTWVGVDGFALCSDLFFLRSFLPCLFSSVLLPLLAHLFILLFPSAFPSCLFSSVLLPLLAHLFILPFPSVFLSCLFSWRCCVPTPR